MEPVFLPWMALLIVIGFLCPSWQIVCQDTITQYLNGSVIHIDKACADMKYILCETL